jgi:hypothetical protein
LPKNYIELPFHKSSLINGLSRQFKDAFMTNLHVRSAGLRHQVGHGIGISATESIEGNRLALPTATASYEYPLSYETAYRALGLAEDAAAVKNILSIAAVMEARARASNNRGLELDAIELRFHAECRLDDMIADHKC